MVDKENKSDGNEGVLTARVFLSIVPLAFLAWTMFTIKKKFEKYPDTLDLNSDGAFTIRDVITIIKDMFLAVGEEYQIILAKNKVGVFLEMSETEPNILWSIGLAIFTYFIISSLHGIWTEDI